jgi:hypothetical protein
MQKPKKLLHDKADLIRQFKYWLQSFHTLSWSKGSNPYPNSKPLNQDAQKLPQVNLCFQLPEIKTWIS